MSELLEQQLRQQLRDVGDEVPAELEPPADLELRVKRFRRRRANQRRTKLLAVAAVLVIAATVVAVIANDRNEKVVQVAGERVLRVAELKPQVVMLDARDRFVVALDARGHQVDTIVVTRRGSTIREAQATSDRRTVWYQATTGGTSNGCGRVVRADIATGSTKIVANARAFAISPDGSKLALSDEDCSSTAHDVTVTTLVSGQQARWGKLHDAIDALRWSPDGTNLVGHDAGRDGWRALQADGSAPLFFAGNVGSFDPSGSFVLIDQNATRAAVVRFTPTTWSIEESMGGTPPLWKLLSIASTSDGVFLVAQPPSGPRGLYELEARRPTLVRSFDFGRITPVPPGR